MRWFWDIIWAVFVRLKLFRPKRIDDLSGTVGEQRYPIGHK